MNTAYSYYEFNKKWQLKTIKTGGYSFPPYIFQDRIPSKMRGLISISKKKSLSVLAHELGHKLINVSHEGGLACPKFSGKGIPGLMGYQGESEILSGLKGRWHKERLLRSPFVYKKIRGKKVYNPDFKKNGIYKDPIYGQFKVYPACNFQLN